MGLPCIELALSMLNLIQALSIRSFRLCTALRGLQSAGVLAHWEARQGELDASTGVFTPRTGEASGTAAAAGPSDRAGFCGWMGPGAVYVGIPGMDAACRGLSGHPGLTTRYGERVQH